jgi:hypothetical protein
MKTSIYVACYEIWEVAVGWRWGRKGRHTKFLSINLFEIVCLED